MQILSRAREAFFFKAKILLKDLIKLTSLSGQECHTGMEFTELTIGSGAKETGGGRISANTRSNQSISKT